MTPRTTDADELAEQPRIPLSRRRVLRAAVRLADRDGIDSLTSRSRYGAVAAGSAAARSASASTAASSPASTRATRSSITP